MSTARDLAERAFTLLQDAFRESESRATELDDELRRRRDPKSRVEERADVLSHRLESVEAECQRWQVEAKRVEELLENEYVKVEQLRKKLDVAESGPDRVSKKEVNFWRQRAEHFDQETREYKNKIASLKQELRSRTEAASGGGFMPPTGSESDLVSALEAAREEGKSLRQRCERQTAELAALASAAASASSTAPLQSEVTSLAADLDRTRRELERVQRELSSAHSERNESRRATAEAEMAHGKLTDTLRERDARLVELSAAHEKIRAELMSKSEHERTLRADLERARTELAASVKRAAQLEQSDQSARAGKEQLQNALSERDRRIQGLVNDLDQERNQQRRSHDELAEHKKRGEQTRVESQARMDALRQEVAAKAAQLMELQRQHATQDKELTALRSECGEARSECGEAREQIAGLEAELKEEKEYSANMNQLANERKDALTRIEEKVEETDERYKEAQWKLGKAQHFERLVRRRKGLIASLLEALRAKSKANSALKAGLDGLRTFKVSSEANHSKLLVRIEELTNELREAQETINKQQGETFLNEQLQTAHAKIKELEGRLNTQVEIIQTLEGDLKVAKATHQARDSASAELEEMRKELATKNELIAKLENDTDDQQRKLSKLRGSESETMRLKAVEEKDKSLIDALEREIAQLREALKRLETEPAGADGAQQGDMSAKLKERDGSITRLMATLKEKDNEIGKLRESIAQWKKKYEFLSTEAPSAYQ